MKLSPSHLAIRAIAPGSSGMPALFDAHNHLHFSELDSVRAEAISYLRDHRVEKIVVNGTHPEDWESVLELYHAFPDFVIPALGLHPWRVNQCPENWRQKLVDLLDQFPALVLGECGLDRWVRGHDLPRQITALRFQLELAKSRRLPITIHCLRAWGALGTVLQEIAPLTSGFLLHSYNGPREMIPRFVEFGAYFSISPYFFRPEKSQQLETFLDFVPIDRLLLETDAPDMAGPPELFPFHFKDRNHPCNLLALHSLLREKCQNSSHWERQIEKNFTNLFADKKS